MARAIIQSEDDFQVSKAAQPEQGEGAGTREEDRRRHRRQS